MIGIPQDAAAASVTIQRDDAYRYIAPTAMDVSDFQTVAWWAARGFPRDLVIGQGRSEYHSGMFVIPALSFAGTPTRLRMTVPMFVSCPNTRTFRWAITRYRLDGFYMGTSPAPEGSVLAQGIWRPDFSNYSTELQNIDFWTDAVPSGQSFYLYLWRYSKQYSNVHIRGAADFTVFAQTGAYDFKNAVPYIYGDGLVWKPAQEKIWQNGAWIDAD